jgi:methanogenic corrinoid protein MtbC1
MKSAVKALLDLKEAEVLAEVQAMRDGGVPGLEIVQDLQEGMRVVGEQYEAGDYFLSELIMSAEIFKRAMDILGDSLSVIAEGEARGTFVIGTVAGDIHDIGKNLVATILGCHGFEVIDLGVDVAAGDFVRAAREHRPELVGLSCLLTTAFDSMRTTIRAIEEAGLRQGLGILIGGGPVTQATCDYVGADGFCLNANEAVAMAERMCGGPK